MGMSELHRVLAGYRVAWTYGVLTWQELQRYTDQAESALAASLGSVAPWPAPPGHE